MKTIEVRFAISIAGSIILFWIGANYLHSAAKNRIQRLQPGQKDMGRSTISLIGLGMLTTLSNPFWYVWWVTVAAGYLVQAQAISTLAVVVFYVGHISADFTWDTALAAATSTGQRWLSPRTYRLLIFVTGGFLLYLGATYFINAVNIS